MGYVYIGVTPSLIVPGHQGGLSIPQCLAEFQAFTGRMAADCFSIFSNVHLLPIILFTNKSLFVRYLWTKKKVTSCNIPIEAGFSLHPSFTITKATTSIYHDVSTINREDGIVASLFSYDFSSFSCIFPMFLVTTWPWRPSVRPAPKMPIFFSGRGFSSTPGTFWARRSERKRCRRAALSTWCHQKWPETAV